MNTTIKIIAISTILLATFSELNGALMTIKNNTPENVAVSIDIGNRDADGGRRGNRKPEGNKGVTLKAGEQKQIDLGGGRCATAIYATTIPNFDTQKPARKIEEVDLCSDHYIHIEGSWSDIYIGT